MKKDRQEEIERSVDAALEGASTDGLPAEGRQAVHEFRRIVKVLRMPSLEAPESVRNAAKSLIPAPERRVLFARLVSSTLQTEGVRSAQGSFQMVFEAGEHRARLLYSPERGEWRVTGKVDGPGWTFERKGSARTCDAEGRFEFRAASLGDSAIVLAAGDVELRVPSAEEASEHEPGPGG